MRIYTSCNDALDFCSICFPSESDAELDYYNLGDDPDSRGNRFGYNTEHPAYQDEDYHCETCGKLLGAEDD